MNRRAQKLGHRPAPEYRIWLSYLGFLFASVGFVIFGVQVQNIGKVYNVSPIVGVGIAAFGHQIITTSLVTCEYGPRFQQEHCSSVASTDAVDSLPEHSASIGVFFNLVRSTWGWIGPFWFPNM